MAKLDSERNLLQDFKATLLLTSTREKTVTIHSTILSKVSQQLRIFLSLSKGSMISTQSSYVNIMKKESSVAVWKRRGLIGLDPRGMGAKGYDGDSFPCNIYLRGVMSSSDYISTSVDVTIPDVDYRHSPDFDLIVVMAEVTHYPKASQKLRMLSRPFWLGKPPPHIGPTLAPEAILFESPCRAHSET